VDVYSVLFNICVYLALVFVFEIRGMSHLHWYGVRRFKVIYGNCKLNLYWWLMLCNCWCFQVCECNETLLMLQLCKVLDITSKNVFRCHVYVHSVVFVVIRRELWYIWFD